MDADLDEVAERTVLLPHVEGATLYAVRQTLRGFFTPAMMNQLRAALEAGVPSVTWTNARIRRAVVYFLTRLA